MSCLRSKVPVPCAKNPYLCGKLEKNINIATSISVHSIRMKKHQITVNILGCQKKETLPRLSIPSLFLCSSLLTWYCSLSWNKGWNFVADLIRLVVIPISPVYATHCTWNHESCKETKKKIAFSRLWPLKVDLLLLCLCSWVSGDF